MACSKCGGKSVPLVSKQEKLKKLATKTVVLPNGQKIGFSEQNKAFKIE